MQMQMRNSPRPISARSSSQACEQVISQLLAKNFTEPSILIKFKHLTALRRGFGDQWRLHNNHFTSLHFNFLALNYEDTK
jgi:hypothetical protein